MELFCFEKASGQFSFFKKDCYKWENGKGEQLAPVLCLTIFITFCR